MREQKASKRGRRLGGLAAVVLALSAATFAGKASAVDEAARSLLPQDIRDKGVLVAGMPLDFEPFNYLDASDKKVGLDVDLFRAVGDVLGVKTEIERLGFASIIPAVQGKRVDVGMSAMGILKPRLKLVSFARYGHFSNGLVVKAGNPANVRNDDGCGARIAAEKGTQPLFLWQDIAAKCKADGKKPINLMVFEGKGAQFLAIETGRADAAAVGFATAVVAAKHSNGKLEAAPGGPVPGGTIECGISFAKDRLELGKALEAAIVVLRKNGTYDAIFKKWGLSEERAEPGVVQ